MTWDREVAFAPRRRKATPNTWRQDLPGGIRHGTGHRTGRRVALYSHDTQGLGHVRRNTLLAAAMVCADPEVSVLLISGAREAAALPLPERTDLAILPALAKDGLGCYSARSPDRFLADVLAARSATLESVLAAFGPHMLVVDKVSRGFRGELEPALRQIRLQHGTRTVLGLRDVLDDIATTRREWKETRTPEAIETLYDQVWVYGDPTIFDPAAEYGWSDVVRAKVRYTGYLGADRERVLPLDATIPTAPSAIRHTRGPFVLGLIGGGQDGAAVADAFARAVFPPGHEGVLVTGPYLPAPDLERVTMLARSRRDFSVHRFVSDVPALAGASQATVSMGGYNSVCELMEARRPTLIVPRMAPRREQAMRADRFAGHGLLEVLSLEDLSPDLVTRWLRSAVSRPARPLPAIDLQGLRKVPALVSDLLESLVDGGVQDVG